MICDKETNLLYLADCLPHKYPIFFHQFEKLLKNYSIDFKLLPHTKDIWARDYMPVQVDRGNFIQFVYNPDYLRKYKKWQESISDVDAICTAIDLKPHKSSILLDGGNVIKGVDKVIITDKVIEENSTIPKEQLIEELELLLQVDKIIIIPKDKKDFTGHADGMVRFLDNDTVIINDCTNERPSFRNHILKPLQEAGLKCIPIPYNPYQNEKNSQAQGIYINYLQMDGIIVLPTYGIEEDEIAVRQMEQLFEGQKIVTIDSNDIAEEGGVLNCITWNILN